VLKRSSVLREKKGGNFRLEKGLDFLKGCEKNPDRSKGEPSGVEGSGA
jgi:hypothetical protein